MKASELTREVAESWEQGSTGESRRSARSRKREWADIYQLVLEFEANEHRRYNRHLLKQRIAMRRKPNLWQRLTRRLSKLFR